jgi:hypothetical protein
MTLLLPFLLCTRSPSVLHEAFAAVPARALEFGVTDVAALRLREIALIAAALTLHFPAFVADDWSRRAEAQRAGKVDH